MCETGALHFKPRFQLTLPAADRALTSSTSYALIIYSCFILHQEPFVLPFLLPSTSLYPLSLSQGCNGALFPFPQQLDLRHKSLRVFILFFVSNGNKAWCDEVSHWVCFLLAFYGVSCVCEEIEGSLLCLQVDLLLALERVESIDWDISGSWERLMTPANLAAERFTKC